MNQIGLSQISETAQFVIVGVVTLPIKSLLVRVPFEAEHRHVVELGVAIDEVIDSCLDLGDDLIRSAVAVVLETSDQAVIAEEIVVDIFSLGDTVGVDVDDVAFLELNILFLVFHAFHAPKDEAVLALQVFCPVLVETDRRVVAGTDEFEIAVLDIENANP